MRVRSIEKMNKDELTRLWATDLSRDEIARALGISRSSLDRAVKLTGLPKKAPVSKQHRPPDPDEQTIKLMTYQLSSKWNADKAAARYKRARKIPASARTFATPEVPENEDAE